MIELNNAYEVNDFHNISENESNLTWIIIMFVEFYYWRLKTIQQEENKMVLMRSANSVAYWKQSNIV